MTHFGRSILLALPLALGVLGGCELVAGVGTRTLHPEVSGDGLPGTVDGGGMASLGNGRIRIANLAVTPGNVDFCIKLSSSSSWGDPIMANSGKEAFFQGGLTYPQVTIPFSAPVGTIDVRFIPIGKLCTATPLSEGDGIVVGDATSTGDATTGTASPIVTILRYGGSTGQSGDPGITEAVVGLPEEVSNASATCAANVCPRFRVVNAAASSDYINFGETDNEAAALPATVTDMLLESPIGPGQAPGSGEGVAPFTKTDSSGYVGGIDSGQAGQTGMTLGIVTFPQGSSSNKAVAIFSPSPIPDTQTLYFIGDPANNLHPLQGLLVEDDTAAAAAGTSPTDGGIDQQFLAKATLTTPPTITVDTFDVELYGLSAPNDSVRSGPIAAGIAARQTDVMCITEVDFDSDKKAIAAQAGNFPYSYWVATNVQTPPTNAAGWYNNTPAKITTAACNGSESGLAAVATCMASDCSTGKSASVDAGVTSTACMEQCGNQIIEVLTTNPTCVDCMIFYLQSGINIDTMQTECGSDVNDPYGQFDYGGMNGTMVLSRIAFATNPDGSPQTEYFVFPGSNYHRLILRTTLQVDSATTMDVYCAQLVYPNNGSSVITYTGPYATPDAGLYPGENTATGDNGWRDEQSLQARDAIEWIQSQSGQKPAIVAGSWISSPGYTPDGGAPVLDPYDPEVYAQFIKAGFAPAHPIGYKPSCEVCNTNPYAAGSPLTTDGTIGFDWTTTFLLNFPAASTLQETFWDTDPSGWTIQIPGMDAGTPFPMSPYYPRSVQILRPSSQ
jgi:hypothetical protein